MSQNIFNHDYKITKKNREKLHGHKSFLIWFTGLSGSGKSTLANLVEIELHKQNISTYCLDGDNIRNGINKDLNFSKNHRKENIRRITQIAKLFVDAGVITLAAFVSPYRKDRDFIKTILGKENVIEIYVNSSLKECERRDVKGLYKKARSGKINDMTGITSTYEFPLNPDLEIDTENHNVNDSKQLIVDYIFNKINKQII